MLRLAVAAYLARFTGQSRVHTESDLRGYLLWCQSRQPDPLVAARPQIEFSVSGSVSSGLCGHHAVPVVARFGADTKLTLVPTSRYLYSG